MYQRNKLLIETESRTQRSYNQFVTNILWTN